MKMIFLCGAVMLLSACGRLDIGMPYFNYYAKSQVDEMFNLNSDQKQLLDKKYAAQMQKFKEEQFPKYALYLEKIARAYQENSVTAETSAQFFDEGEKIFAGIAPYWQDTIIEFAHGLRPDQIIPFEKFFFERWNKDQKKLSSEKDRRKKQKEIFERWIDQTIGSLTKEQEKKLDQHIQDNPRPKVLSWKSQEHVFRQFKSSFSILEQRRSFLEKFLNDWQSVQLPEYVRARELYIENAKSFFIDLSLNLTDKQRKKLIQNLHKRAQELRKLAV